MEIHLNFLKIIFYQSNNEKAESLNEFPFREMESIKLKYLNLALQSLNNLVPSNLLYTPLIIAFLKVIESV